MTSELRVTTLSNATGDGPATLTQQSAARAWCAWDNDTNDINDSLNYSSFTDDGTANRTLTMTNAFSSTNICLASSVGAVAGNPSNRNHACTVESTSSTKSEFYDAANGQVDTDDFCGITVHGDLA